MLESEYGHKVGYSSILNGNSRESSVIFVECEELIRPSLRRNDQMTFREMLCIKGSDPKTFFCLTPHTGHWQVVLGGRKTLTATYWGVGIVQGAHESSVSGKKALWQ